MCDCNIPSAFREKMRKARKPHNCCECLEKINIGENYQYCSGVWDGEPDSYKTCISCLKLRENYESETGECAAFGHLRESISNAFYLNYGVKEFINDYPEYSDELKKLFSIKNQNTESDKESSKYWAVHGGSDTWFAAKSKDDANELVSMFNSIAKEYGNPESSRVVAVEESELASYHMELSTRLTVGDAEYLNP
jgi:hypothetical protein